MTPPVVNTGYPNNSLIYQSTSTRFQAGTSICDAIHHVIVNSSLTKRDTCVNMKSKKRIEIINGDNNILLDDIIDTTNSETAT